MNKKEKRISTVFLIFIIFLVLCAVINFAALNIGAALCALGAAFVFLCLYLGDKDQKNIEQKTSNDTTDIQQ